MSCTADAYMVAIARAFPTWTVTDREHFDRDFFAGLTTDDQNRAVEQAFATVTRADIGRPPLPDDGTLHSCRECYRPFTGPGELCPTCARRADWGSSLAELLAASEWAATLLRHGPAHDRLAAAVADVRKKGLGT